MIDTLADNRVSALQKKETSSLSEKPDYGSQKKKLRNFLSFFFILQIRLDKFGARFFAEQMFPAVKF